MRGAISLLKYLSAALMMPRAPRLPIEVGFADSWEITFGQTCSAVANSLSELSTEPAVADAIIGALAPLIEDFEVAKRAARAAIPTFTDGGVR
jgi:hypothetical protein